MAVPPPPRRGLGARLAAIPDGSILRLVFVGLLVMSATVLWLDFRDMVEADGGFELVWTPRTPVPQARPGGGDHVRPYLPLTRPAEIGAPRQGAPKLPFDLPKAAESEPMRFERVAGARAAAIGRIEPGTADAFARFLERQGGEVKTVVLHSPGGSVTDALAMARAIRAAKLDTEVPDDAYCASSCPLVFAGGVMRHAGPKAWVGVHQVYALPEAMGSLQQGMSAAQATSADCQQALVDFGIDPRLWIHAMQTPKDSLYLLTPEQMMEYRLATGQVLARQGAGGS
jgi:hypothetical protein